MMTCKLVWGLDQNVQRDDNERRLKEVGHCGHTGMESGLGQIYQVHGGKVKEWS